MNRTDRKQARRISEYVDGLVVHRREERSQPVSSEDRGFCELVELARALRDIELTAPDGFGEELIERLPKLASENGNRRWAFVDLRLFARVGPLRTAAAVAALVTLGVALVLPLATTPTLSAAEVLNRGDLALAGLVGPTQVLYRRWSVTSYITAAAGGTTAVRESISHEWMDGSDGRVAGRLVGPRGNVVLAYTSVRENGDLRPHVYFAPGFSNEARGLLNIEPSRREFRDAVAVFPPLDRQKLTTYLDRGYIFEPISGERRFNKTVLQPGGESAPLPRLTLSLREDRLPSGSQVYVVEIVDPARVQFRWKSQGPPAAWIERRETLRYIARDTHLSVRAEETYYMDDGRRVVTVRELLETRVADANADRIDPFALSVPEGTPVRRQSAVEQLSAVSTVLRRLPGIPLSLEVATRPAAIAPLAE